MMAAVEISFKHNFLKKGEIQIRKFSALKDHHQITKTPNAIQGPEKFVINLSEHVLTESEESVLKRGLNFTITNRASNLDMACAPESARSRLTPAFSVEFCWSIRCMLEK
jgi:23S rRNA maturation mini-RNase III